ncbi:hypothetical protein Hdeb2414_s0541g00914131 [Helianthus debilis subsp. tardiflorus]
MLSKSIRSRSTIVIVISGVVPTETQIHHRRLCVPLSLSCFSLRERCGGCRGCERVVVLGGERGVVVVAGGGAW